MFVCCIHTVINVQCVQFAPFGQHCVTFYDCSGVLEDRARFLLLVKRHSNGCVQCSRNVFYAFTGQ